MMADFSTLIADARQFFAELEDNNTKAWFHANKATYEARLKTPALELLQIMSAKVAELAGGEVTTKLFRAHRDVRFSKDKSPYNLHLHMLWSPQGAGAQPAFFFGVARDYATAGGGLMGFDKAQQSDWRAFAAEREGARLQGKLDALVAAGARMDPPELKRVPAPYPADHPQADLLRRKSCTIWMPLEQTQDLPGALSQVFTQINPALDDLRAFL
ncbi:MAG: TIGR02453 family protein [Pseudomonadota bacterium]